MKYLKNIQWRKLKEDLMKIPLKTMLMLFVVVGLMCAWSTPARAAVSVKVTCGMVLTTALPDGGCQDVTGYLPEDRDCSLTKGIVLKSLDECILRFDGNGFDFVGPTGGTAVRIAGASKLIKVTGVKFWDWGTDIEVGEKAGPLAITDSVFKGGKVALDLNSSLATVRRNVFHAGVIMSAAAAEVEFVNNHVLNGPAQFIPDSRSIFVMNDPEHDGTNIILGDVIAGNYWENAPCVREGFLCTKPYSPNKIHVDEKPLAAHECDLVVKIVPDLETGLCGTHYITIPHMWACQAKSFTADLEECFDEAGVNTGDVVLNCEGNSITGMPYSRVEEREHIALNLLFFKGSVTNCVSAHTAAGISLREGSYGVILKDNLIIDAGVGIYSDGTEKPLELTGNTIRGVLWDIQYPFVKDGLIYNNDFDRDLVLRTMPEVGSDIQYNLDPTIKDALNISDCYGIGGNAYPGACLGESFCAPVKISDGFDDRYPLADCSENPPTSEGVLRVLSKFVGGKMLSNASKGLVATIDRAAIMMRAGKLETAYKLIEAFEREMMALPYKLLAADEVAAEILRAESLKKSGDAKYLLTKEMNLM